MIHISLEELFRSIQQAGHHEQPKRPAHNNNNNNNNDDDDNDDDDDDEDEDNEQQSNNALINRLGDSASSSSGGGCDNSKVELGAECTTANEERNLSNATKKVPLFPALASSSRRAMSSILPQTTYGNLTRDTNNNSAPCDEDEVQAVLITGCGSKIGSNIAVAFAARGLKVALVDFDIKQTEQVARECQDESPKNRPPLQIVADISQLAEAHKVIDRTIDAFGRLDVLVNTVNNASLMEVKFNSGSGDDDPHVFEQYHKIIASNMHAVTYLCISAAPYLKKTKGSIVNVSSITNNETGSYKFAYCMSKSGISTLTKCLATDLAPDIKVICVSPKSDA